MPGRSDPVISQISSHVLKCRHQNLGAEGRFRFAKLTAHPIVLRKSPRHEPANLSAFLVR